MPAPTRRPQTGPPLPVPALAAAALTIAAAATFADGPRPSAGAAESLRYVREHTGQMHAVGFLVFATAFPLAVLSAAVYRRLRALGVTAPGPAIALVGGTLACMTLIVSGMVTWTVAQSAHDIGPGVCRALLDLAFVAGAAGFTVPLALLVAGIAVPAAILRLAPRPLAVTGLVIAVAGVVSSLTMLTSALYPVLPVVRFGGLLWLVVIAFVLPITRARAQHGPAFTGERLAEAR